MFTGLLAPPHEGGFKQRLCLSVASRAHVTVWNLYENYQTSQTEWKFRTVFCVGTMEVNYRMQQLWCHHECKIVYCANTKIVMSVTISVKIDAIVGTMNQ